MFALNIVVTKLATARLALGVGFVVMVLVNILFCGVAFAAQLAWRTEPLQWNGFAFAIFLGAGVFSTYFGRFFFFESIHRLGPARASAFQLTSPLFASLIAWAVLGEELGVGTLLAILTTIYGLYLVGSGRGRSLIEAHAPRIDIEAGADRAWSRLRTLNRSALPIALGGSLAYAISTVMRAAAVHRWNEPILGALLGALSGVALHLVTSPEMRNLVGALKLSDRRGVMLYAASGVLTIAGQILAIASMAFIPAAVSTLITLCSPILVLPMSYWLLSNEEGITGKAVFGTLLSIAGVAVVILSAK